MRRASVIGPLILIAVGALFLLRNVIPELRVGQIIAWFWPYLLIAWGVLRLAEIGAWAMQSKPLPRNGVSGGEWVLVVFVCIFGSAFHHIQNRDFWFPDSRAFRHFVVGWGEPFSYSVNPVEVACGKTPRIVIENYNGNARIIGADVDSVKASGRKSIRTFRQREAEHANQTTQLELVAQGQDVIVRANQERADESMDVSDDLDITVPKGASIEAHGRTGDFTISNIDGSVDITSDNAGVRVQNIGGGVRVDLRKSDIVRAAGVKGNVELKGYGDDVELQDIEGQVIVNGTYTGQVEFKNLAKPLRYEGSSFTLNLERLPGQIRYEPGELRGTDIVGPVRLDARSTNVELTDFTQTLDLTLSRTGDIKLRPASALARMDVHTDSGDIDLALPAPPKFDLKATTDHGDGENEYGSPLKMDDNSGSATISGGEGGPQLRVATGHGHVVVRKSGG